MNSDLDQLGERIAEQAAHLDAAMHRLLADLREFDQRGGWHVQGAASCAHWLAWRVGWDLVTARDHVRVARRLAEFPAIDDALRRGELSYSKVRALLRVATPANEGLLLDHAQLMTASQLEKLCRKYALVQRHGQDQYPQIDEQRRYVRRRDTDDGMVKIEAVLHPEEAETVWTMLDHLAMQRLREPGASPRPDSAESCDAARLPGSAVRSAAEPLPGSAVRSAAEPLPGSAVRSAAEPLPGSAVRSAAEPLPGSDAARTAAPPGSITCSEYGRQADDSSFPEDPVARAALETLWPGYTRAGSRDDSAESCVTLTPARTWAVRQSEVEPPAAPRDHERVDSLGMDRVPPVRASAVAASAAADRSGDIDARCSGVSNSPPVVSIAGGSALLLHGAAGPGPSDDSAESYEAPSPEPRKSLLDWLLDEADALAGNASDALAGDASDALAGDTSDALAGDTSDALAGDTSDALAGDTSDALAGDTSDAPRSRCADALRSRCADALRSRCADALRSRCADALRSRCADALHSRCADALRSRCADALCSDQADARDRSVAAAAEIAAAPEPRVPGPHGRSELRERADAARRAFSRADALVAIAQAYLRGDRPERAPIEVVVTIPASGLHKGVQDPVEVGEIGASFVSGETARRLSCDAGVIEVIEDDHGAPLSVGRKRRTIAGALKRALRKRDTACTYPGCTNRSFLEGHHIKHWADGGETSLANTALLCSLHHRHVHEYGYTIELGADQRPRFRDPRGQLVAETPARPATAGLGWPQIRAANASLAIDAATIAGPWDGTPVDYGRIIGHLAFAEGLR